MLEDPEFDRWLKNSESWVKTYAAFKVPCLAIYLSLFLPTSLSILSISLHFSPSKSCIKMPVWTIVRIPVIL